jgi:hypothetical protein
MSPPVTTYFFDEMAAAEATFNPAPPATNLRAAYLFTEGTGTVVGDSGPNALHGHLPVGASASNDTDFTNAPTWSSSPAWHPGWLTFNGDGGIALPAHVFTGEDVTVYALVQPTQTQVPHNKAILGWAGTASNGLYFGLLSLDGTPGCMEDIVSPIYAAVCPWYSGWDIVTFVFKKGLIGANAGKVYLNGVDKSGWFGIDATPTDAAFAQAGPQNFVWGGSWYPIFSGFFGALAALAVYDGADNPATVASTTAWFQNLAGVRGIPLNAVHTYDPAQDLVIVLGDSIAIGYKSGAPLGAPAGTPAYPVQYYSLIRAGLATPMQWTIRAIGGLKTTQVKAIFDNVVAPQLAGRTGRAVVLLQTGHNDSFADTSELQALCTDMLGAGVTDVIVETGLPSGNILGLDETARKAWNTFIKGTLAGTHIGVADSGSDATIGPGWSSGLLPYYPDGTHPSASCDAIRAPYFLGALNAKGYT